MQQEPVTIPLAQLGIGACGILIGNQLDPDDAASLRAMGLRPECRLRVCKRGEPCIVTVNSGSCRIALSRRLADQVLVRPE